MTKTVSISAGKQSTKQAIKLINWSALSLKLADNRDSIRENRYPKKYEAKINQLIQFIEWWIEGKEMISPDALKDKLSNIDLYSIIVGEK